MSGKSQKRGGEKRAGYTKGGGVARRKVSMAFVGPRGKLRGFFRTSSFERLKKNTVRRKVWWKNGTCAVAMVA